MREPCVTTPAHEQERPSAVLCRSTWRLLLATPGFHHESPHNHHNDDSQTQPDEVARGIIPRHGTWGSWEREEDEHQPGRSTPPSPVDLPTVALLHLLVLPGQWSAGPSLTLSSLNTTWDFLRVVVGLPLSSFLCILSSYRSSFIFALHLISTLPHCPFPFSLLVVGIRLRSNPQTQSCCTENRSHSVTASAPSS